MYLLETSLIITKIWADYDNLHNLRPESITVNLFKKVGEADPVFVTSQVVTATDGWAWTFADLPRYEDGVLIVYSITENEIPAYTTEINGFTITNTLIVNDQTATKTWKPDGLLARMRFDVEFQLHRYTTNPDTPEPVGTPVILSAPD